MIPVLYDEFETDFGSNGLGLLSDCINCFPDEKRNDYYEITLQYPVNGRLFDKIKSKAWIKAKANDRYPDQLFRIYKISKPINGVVTVYGEHKSYELRDNFIPFLEYTGNCSGALLALKNASAFATGFNFSSDISMSADFKAEAKYFWEAIVGSEGSVIDTYGNGADIIRDNNNITIKQEGGLSNNVLIAYRKNMTGFTCEEDWSKCYTAIFPYARDVNDNLITLSEKYIYSPLVARDRNPRILKVDFTTKFSTDEEINEVNLRSKCGNYFNNTEVDKPSLKYKIEFVALSKTEEYKDQGLTETIGLFDTVIIRHELYGLNAAGKIQRLKYDALKERPVLLEFGDIALNGLKSTINGAISEAKKGMVNTEYLDKAIKAFSSSISSEGYVRVNPTEILLMDNENLSQAQNVWRWNKNGLQASTNGYSGNYIELAKNGKLVINKDTALLNDMHVIIDTVDLNLTAPAGQSSYEYNYEHNLGYVPAFLGFQVDTLSGGKTQLPVIGLSDSMAVTSLLKATADSKYIKISMIRNADNATSSTNLKLKLFIYKETLV